MSGSFVLQIYLKAIILQVQELVQLRVQVRHQELVQQHQELAQRVLPLRELRVRFLQLFCNLLLKETKKQPTA
jgi:hypothetical protein